MKIRLALLMKDEGYLTRFYNALSLQYADQVELSAFTQAEQATEAIERDRPDILLLEEGFDGILSDLPRRTQPVFFVNKNDIESLGGYPAVCKYQRVSDIFRALAAIYAERVDADLVRLKSGVAAKRIVTFLPGAGGVGASTAAAAFACYLAEHGERVLYLNLEQNGVADHYFQASGDGDFSRVLYALQMTGATAVARVENTLRQAESGVYFFSGSAYALDMLELDEEMLRDLFEILSVVPQFDWIVTDMDLSLGKKICEQIKRSRYTVLVSNGSATANRKLMRAVAALEVYAQTEQLPMERVAVMYNCFSSRTGQKIESKAVKELGGIGRVENAQTAELLRLLAQNQVFDALMQ